MTKSGKVVALDAKMSMQNVQAVKLPASFKKLFPQVEHMHLVTFGGEQMQLSPECLSVPIHLLHDFLLKI